MSAAHAQPAATIALQPHLSVRAAKQLVHDYWTRDSSDEGWGRKRE